MYILSSGPLFLMRWLCSPEWNIKKRIWLMTWERNKSKPWPTATQWSHQFKSLHLNLIKPFVFATFVKTSSSPPEKWTWKMYIYIQYIISAFLWGFKHNELSSMWWKRKNVIRYTLREDVVTFFPIPIHVWHHFPKSWSFYHIPPRKCHMSPF